MRRFFILLFLGLIFAAPTIYAAAENDPHAGHQMSGMDMNNMDMSNMYMSTMDTGHDHQAQHGNEGTLPNAPSGGGHMHVAANVPETPPNVLVLSIFALVNAAFLLTGAVLKIRMRRGRLCLCLPSSIFICFHFR